MVSLGKRIKDLRTDRDLTQKELGTKVGVSESAISLSVYSTWQKPAKRSSFPQDDSRGKTPENDDL